MTSHKSAVVYDGDPLIIRGYDIFATLRAAGMRPIFVGAKPSGWRLDGRRRDDAIAALEHAGYRVVVR